MSARASAIRAVRPEISGLPAMAWRPAKRPRASSAPRVLTPERASAAIAGSQAQAPKWFQNAESDAAKPEATKTALPKSAPDSDTASPARSFRIPHAPSAKWRRRNRIPAIPGQGRRKRKLGG